MERFKPGKAGEICIRGLNIFKGYLNNPEETNNAFWGDWFRSGDVGMLNEDGYIFHRGQVEGYDRQRRRAGLPQGGGAGPVTPVRRSRNAPS